MIKIVDFIQSYTGLVRLSHIYSRGLFVAFGGRPQPLAKSFLRGSFCGETKLGALNVPAAAAETAAAAA